MKNQNKKKKILKTRKNLTKIVRISNKKVQISSNIIFLFGDKLVIYKSSIEDKTFSRKRVNYKPRMISISNNLIMHNFNYEYICNEKKKNRHTYMYTNYVSRILGKKIDLESIEYLAYLIKSKNICNKTIYHINYENCTFELLNSEEFMYLSKILYVWPVSHCPEKNSFIAFYFMDKVKINLFLDSFVNNMVIKLLAKFFKTYNDIENYVSMVLTDDLINQIKKDFENLEVIKDKNLFSYYIFSAYKIYIKYRNMIYIRCKVLADEIISNKIEAKNKILNIQTSNILKNSFESRTKNKYEILNKILNKYNLTQDDIFKMSNRFLKYRQKIQEEIKEYFDLEEIFR